MYYFNNPIDFQCFYICSVRTETFCFNNVVIPIIHVPNKRLLIYFNFFYNNLIILKICFNNLYTKMLHLNL